ncbi:MAG: Hsp70 family protein [Spirochaetaceae bacterium]|nr:Hsp70 family protein [Spirochaetaceae bacterium]
MAPDREPIIGIDLGTTNSEVAIIAGGVPRIVGTDDDAVMPSCVGLDDSGAVVVGHQARNQYAVAPERTVRSIKRLMGSDTRVRMGSEAYSPPEISAFILKALAERAAAALGRPVHNAVITVPAYFTDAQRQATREAGRIAGLEVVRIINEPTAAALAYHAADAGARTIMVYDLGGGTFDVSVVRIESGVVEVLATSGDNHLGGDDFDAIILDRINSHLETETGVAGVRDDRLLQARLRRAAEQAKIELSRSPYALVEEDHVATVDGAVKHLSWEWSRTDFEGAIEELLAGTMRAVTTALGDAAVRPSELDRILLVGGSTRIPRVSQLLAERLGHEPHGEVNPELCVALGAGVQAGIEMGLDMPAVLVDITPYTFGTSVLGELDGRSYAHQFVPLIRRNAKLPVTHTGAFYTVYEDQRSVKIKVYQGESRDALQNVEIGTFLFEGLNRERGAYDRGLLFTYHLDLDGILNVHAVERATGREIRGVIEGALDGSTEEAVDASRERVAARWGPSAEPHDAEGAGGAGPADAPELPPEVRDTLSRAEAALAAAPDEDKEEIVDLMEDLRDAAQSGDTERAAGAMRELDEILFYLE